MLSWFKSPVIPLFKEDLEAIRRLASACNDELLCTRDIFEIAQRGRI